MRKIFNTNNEKAEELSKKRDLKFTVFIVHGVMHNLSNLSIEYFSISNQKKTHFYLHDFKNNQIIIILFFYSIH